MFVLAPNFSKTLQPVTQAAGMELAAQSLAETTRTQVANTFRQTAVKEIKMSGKMTNTSKIEVILRRTNSDGAMQKLGPQILQQQFHALFH